MNKQELKQLNEELDYILEDLDTIQNKYYPDIDRHDFNDVISMDPTYNQRNNKLGSYGKWLLSIYKKNNNILDEHEKIFDTLQFYDRNKRHFKNNDIFKYSIDELFDEYEDLKDLDLLSDRQKRKQISKIDIETSDEIDKIYEDDKWILYVPKTKNASVKLGRNTHWCTAVEGNNRYFGHYSKEGPLVVCINKTTGEKYQYHKESDQFKNVQDYEADRNILSQDVWNYLKSNDFKKYKEEYFKYIDKGFPHGSFAAWLGEDLTGQTYEGDLDCSEAFLTSLFGCPSKVTGDFDCSDNKLTSLQGAPQEVGGNFYCSDNKLISLEGAPQKVEGNFNCSDNQLTSLQGAPQEVGGDFGCSYNNLTSLQGAPQKVEGNFNCSDNQLTSLQGAPQEVGGDFNCSWNQLTSLEGSPREVKGDFSCSLNQLTSLESSPQKVEGYFDCSFNQLTSLQGSPQKVKGFFSCSSNQLTSLQGATQEVGGSFYCNNNQLTSLEGSPQEVGGRFDCQNNPKLKSLDGIGEVEGTIYSDIK